MGTDDPGPGPPALPLSTAFVLSFCVMPKPKSVIGWCFVAVSILFETIEHIDFINSHLPRQFTAAINEPLVLIAVVVGFLLVLSSIHEGRSEMREQIAPPERVGLVPPSNPVARSAKRSNHNMKFTGAKYIRSENGSGIVVACFQNKPIPHTPLQTFRFARTSIAFEHESGAAIGEVSPAAWAEVKTPTVDFEAGVTHCAAVAVFTQSGHWGACRVESQTTSWGDMGYSVEHPPLPMGTLKATVTLIGAMNESLPPARLKLTLAQEGTAMVEID